MSSSRRGVGAIVLLAVSLLVGCAYATPQEAAERPDPPAPRLERVAELNRLYAYWKGHCDEAFVTPEVIRLYEAAVREMDEAGYGYGRNSNFAGVKPPRAVLVECAEEG